MAIGLPFTPLQASATAGKTVKVTGNATPTSVSGSLVLTSTLQANNIRIYNAGTVLAFVRLSGEATPTATRVRSAIGSYCCTTRFGLR